MQVSPRLMMSKNPMQQVECKQGKRLIKSLTRTVQNPVEENICMLEVLKRTVCSAGCVLSYVKYKILTTESNSHIQT